MRCPPTWALLLLLSACNAHISGSPNRAEDDDNDGADAGTDAPTDAGIPGDAAVLPDAPIVLGAWKPAAKVTGVSSTTLAEDDVTLSANTLEMIYAVGATNGKDLYYASRATVTSAWTGFTKLPFDTDANSEETPRFSADDKTLYFASGRGNTNGNLDVYAVARTAANNTTWSTTLTKVDGPNSTASDKWYMQCSSNGTNRYVLVRNVTDTNTDLFEGTVGAAPTAIATFNTTSNESGVFITQDCLTAYYSSNSVTPAAIFTSHRDTLAGAWSKPTQVVDFKDAAGNQEDPWVSADQRTFAFATDTSGTKDVYISTR